MIYSKFYFILFNVKPKINFNFSNFNCKNVYNNRPLVSVVNKQDFYFRNISSTNCPNFDSNVILNLKHKQKKVKLLSTVNSKNLILKKSSFSTKKEFKFKKIIDGDDVKFVKINNFVNNVFPTYLIPYIELTRLNRLTPIMFLLYPSLWSISLATQNGNLPDVPTVLLFVGGAILMRSAGCIINDLIDKKIDLKVSRTKNRPLPNKELNDLQASVALLACLSASLNILLSFDIRTILWGCASLPLVLLYPLMKSLIKCPQLFLGLTFNWGAILGYSAVQMGIIDWSIILPLYISGVFWTLIYDTIYAFQDIKDDKKLNLYSSSILIEKNPKFWLHLFSVGMMSNLLLTGYNSDLIWPFYASLGLSAFKLNKIIREFKQNDSLNCYEQFKKNSLIGYFILIGIILSVLFKDQKDTENNKAIETT